MKRWGKLRGWWLDAALVALMLYASDGAPLGWPFVRSMALVFAIMVAASVVMIVVYGAFCALGACLWRCAGRVELPADDS